MIKMEEVYEDWSGPELLEAYRIVIIKEVLAEEDPEDKMLAMLSETCKNGVEAELIERLDPNRPPF